MDFFTQSKVKANKYFSQFNNPFAPQDQALAKLSFNLNEFTRFYKNILLLLFTHLTSIIDFSQSLNSFTELILQGHAPFLFLTAVLLSFVQLGNKFIKSNLHLYVYFGPDIVMEPVIIVTCLFFQEQQLISACL